MSELATEPARAATASVLNAMAPAVTPLAVGVKEAADMLRVSVKTVRREISSGRLAAVHIGKYVRLRIETLEQYLLERETRGNVHAQAGDER